MSEESIREPGCRPWQFWGAALIGLFLPGFMLALFQLSHGVGERADELFLFTMVYGLVLTAPGTFLGALGIVWLARRGWLGLWQTVVLAGAIGASLFALLDWLFFRRFGGGEGGEVGHLIALSLALITGVAVWAVLRLPLMKREEKS